MSKQLSRAQEVEAVLRREETENVPIDEYHALAHRLAAEVDELRGKLDDVRFGIGCARGQRTTQFCADLSQRNAVIAELLAMLKPTPELIANAQMDYQAAFEFDVTRNFYHRALEIAGRANS